MDVIAERSNYDCPHLGRTVEIVCEYAHVFGSGKTDDRILVGFACDQFRHCDTTGGAPNGAARFDPAKCVHPVLVA